jgi:NADPH-dependent curcumin reductase CurA
MITIRSHTEGRAGPENFEVVEGEIPAPGPDQALCRSLFLSLDPYQRLSLLPPDSRVPTVLHPSRPLGRVVDGPGVAEVVESNIAGLEPGAVIVHDTGWQMYSLVRAGSYRRVDGVSPLSAALGVVGMPGFTAWVGLKCIGQPNAGQTVVVSAASGAVGSLVVQLARRWGCRSVGIAGSEEKCRWVRDELGADDCVSYRSGSMEQDLRQACPQGIDVYFDNVGGDVLVAVLANMNSHGRIVVCGRIAHLNERPDVAGADRMPILLGHVLTKRLTVQGFGQSELSSHWDEFMAEVVPLVASGDIRFREDIVDGLDQIPVAWPRLFDGTKFGKLVARV